MNYLPFWLSEFVDLFAYLEECSHSYACILQMRIHS